MSQINIKKLELYNQYFDINRFSQAYNDNLEYIEDLRCLVDLYVNAIFKIRQSNFKDNTNYLGLRGIVITDAEVNSAMTGSMVDRKYIKVDENIEQSILASFNHINNRVKLCHFDIKLENFFNKHNCNFITKLAIIFTLVSELDRKYERLFGYLQDDNSMKKPTLGLVYTAALLTENITLSQALDLLDNKLTSLIFDTMGIFEYPCFLSKSLKMRKISLDFFLNNHLNSFKQSLMCKIFDPENEEIDNIIIDKGLNENLVSETQTILDSNLNDNIVHLYGPSGSGKKLHIKHVGKKLNKKIFFVDLKNLNISENGNTVISSLSNVYVGAFLYDGLVCFYNCDFDDGYQDGLEYIISDIFRYIKILFLLNEKPRYLANPSHRFLPRVSFKLGDPTINESAEIWQYYSRAYEFEKEIDFKQISNKFKYTSGQIKDILLKSKIQSSVNNNIISEKILIKTCREYAIHNLDKRAALINCHFTFDDLVIDKDQKDILVNACNYIKYKDIIYEDWGFSTKVPYGRGLSVLLYGPPGTGKTMGAQVIANELGLQLYKIDLSQIMNKYIGETEKNLRDIFTEAKKSNAILLFDEADSLFGKRTDVKDSNDKNANNETSFLLQKMEEYDGVSILTTNKFNNFDEAFRRRIKFIVNFPMPGVEMRRQLWQKVFPKQAPLGEDFDDWFLADRFELSGSYIKSIAILASYLAFAEKSKIMMKHILSALKYEYYKLGKVISNEDLGIYGVQV